MNYSKIFQEGAKKAAKWVQENPKNTAAYTVAGTVLLVPGIIAGPALAAAGFGAAGPVAGTIAAGAQASIGNVAAGSLFATLQSAGMAGYGAAVVNGVIAAGGGLGMAATGARQAWQSMRKNPKGDLILIENTWASLNSDVKQDSGKCDVPVNDITNITEVKEAVEKYWECVSADEIQELSDTIPKQIEAYEKNVGDTGY
ncbi:hypothetical protein F4806DRAFT_492138 [Annulohypoxylon nitens]|nr:hypothetical protein F4806DRAFT_492138 [Annulohypoxylon nitens]